MTHIASNNETCARDLTEAEIEAIGGGATLPVSIAPSLLLSSTLEARIARLKSELHEALPRF